MTRWEPEISPELFYLEKCRECGERMYLDNSGTIRFCVMCDTEVEVKLRKPRNKKDLLGHIFY